MDVRDFRIGYTAAEIGGRFRGGWGWRPLRFGALQNPINPIMLKLFCSKNKHLAELMCITQLKAQDVVGDGGVLSELRARSSTLAVLRR